MEYIKLSSHTSIPQLGCMSHFRDTAITGLRVALASGYRHVDTAAVYRNEQDVGKVVAECSILRADLFVTSKLAPADQGYDSALAAFEVSRHKLGLDYLDLYLIHWPGKAKLKPESEENAKARHGSWRALEHLYKEGKVKAIGVSNFTVEHLEELLSVCEIKPMVNQVEMHPWLTQEPLRRFCQTHGIHVTAYASLAQGELLDNTTVVSIAQGLERTPAQILLRWGLQSGVIPKSATPDRIQSNAQLFDFSLSDSDMSLLNQLNCDRHVCWDPTTIR